MKKINLLIIASILVTLGGFAQQFPLQSQYQFNYPTINPAASAEHDFYRARASFRQQWVGLTDNPISTQILTVTKGFDNNGLGVTVFSDKTGGAFNKSGASIIYSQKVKFEKADLYFGVSGGAATINLSSIDDPAVLSGDDVIPEFTFGVYYKVNDISLGFSVPGLLNANMELSGSSENTIDRHFYTMFSYQKKLNDDWSVYPAVLVKTTANQNQFDANINFKLKNKLWFGTSYRKDFGPTVYVGIDFGRLLSIYSMDVSTNEVADYSNGSHEFTFGYDFIPEDQVEKEISDKKLIFDKDKDGVQDEDDICPNEYGDAYANGCPDFDKDGVPDKYDLCPHLFGSAGLQGCPDLTYSEERIIAEALSDLKFGFDKDEIDYYSYNTLTDLAKLMLSNPKMYLLIEGFASSEGTEEYNLSLSARRAKAVQQFFIKRGIERRRLVIDFHGEDDPLNSNFTERDKAENRRVEFKIKYHLFDKIVSSDLKQEYDSLMKGIYGSNPYINPIQKIEVVQKNETVNSELEKEKDRDTNSIVIAKPDQVLVDQEEEVLVSDTVSEQDVSNVVSNNDVKSEYFVIVQVFSDVSNAIDYTYSSEDDLEYTTFNGKYYVFAFSSNIRKEAEEFRNTYGKGSWILEPR
ncbi:MAG: hypothetical protein CMD16_03060 [Flavobacteriales bacterium]|nr:hypothetical protein [Flavobacteriales bacterium]|tara:strand:- start:14780 stop:16681 length:1902 start_codon:yes stop_codon:yes gene_type:complete